MESQVNSEGGGTLGRLPEVRGGSEDVTSVIPGKGQLNRGDMDDELDVHVGTSKRKLVEPVVLLKVDLQHGYFSSHDMAIRGRGSGVHGLT